MWFGSNERIVSNGLDSFALLRRVRRAGVLSLVKTCWVFAKVRLAQETCAAVRSVPGPTSVMAGINSVEQTIVKRHPAVGTSSKSHVRAHKQRLHDQNVPQPCSSVPMAMVDVTLNEVRDRRRPAPRHKRQIPIMLGMSCCAPQVWRPLLGRRDEMIVAASNKFVCRVPP